MAAAPRSDGPVLVDRDHALTRDDLDAAVASAAADLVDRGVGRGDRVAWQLPNCVDAAHPDQYPTPITADEYLQERLREIKLA